MKKTRTKNARRTFRGVEGYATMEDLREAKDYLKHKGYDDDGDVFVANMNSAQSVVAGHKEAKAKWAIEDATRDFAKAIRAIIEKHGIDSQVAARKLDREVDDLRQFAKDLLANPEAQLPDPLRRDIF